MAIPGVQIIYRLQTTIRLFIDHVIYPNVDSFNLYFSNAVGGPFVTLLGSVDNIPSDVPSVRGKIVFEFHTDDFVGWNNDVRNYIVIAPVTGGVEGAQIGPMTVFTRAELLVPKEYSVMYGLDRASQKFIPVSVNPNGNITAAIVP